MKKLVAFFVLPLLLLAPTSAFADAFDPLAIPMGNNDIIQYVVENGSIETTSAIRLMPMAVSSSSATRSWSWCTGLNDPVCDPTKAPPGLSAVSVFGPCTTADQENCIDSLEMGTDASALTPATLIKNTTGLTFPPNPEYNYPGSSTISLWNEPGLVNGGGKTTYAVTATAHLWFDQGKFHMTDFFAGVEPYAEKTGPYKAMTINTSPSATPANRYNWQSGPDTYACAYIQDGVCGLTQDFAPNTIVKLKIRLSSEVGGWFQGRIQSPTMDVKPLSPTSNLITIQAQTATVPRLSLAATRSKFTDQQKIWLTNNGDWPALTSQASGPQAGMPADAFPFIDFYRSALKDTAVGTNTFWNFVTTAYGNGSRCLQDKSKLLGIVSTNAMAYDGTAPSFSDGTLNYHVAGLHFMPDGVTPVLGTYSLLMRSDVARCLYKFSSAPISATISVFGGGDQTVATTVSGEANGWLSLFAAGFTFSDKTIQVKFTQTPTQAAPLVATTTPAKKAPPAKSITCVKGRSIKTVTTATCPSGYKKK